MSPSEDAAQSERAEHARELRQYLWGYGLAIALTLVPFALVNWSLLSAHGLCLAIGAFALLQVIVHFRCFLHINPPRQKTDDLQLILFSGLLLFFMIAGTIWILASLGIRTG